MRDRRHGDRTATVVLPVLNEADSVVDCIDEARRGLAAAGIDGEILVIDNGSTDGSVRLARDAGARVVRETVLGYGAALRRGIADARGEIVVMADADSTYDLTRIGELIKPIIDDEVDVVIGGRLDGVNRNTMPLLHRLVGTPILSFLVRRACGDLDVRDSQSGFRAIDTAKARRLGLKATGMEFASEMLIRASQDGLRVAERHIGYRPRVGESKLQTMRDGIRHIQLILLLAPQLILFWPGLLLLGGGLLLGIVSVVNPLGFDVGQLQWQPIFFGPILIVLGAMGAVSGAVVAHRSPLLRPDIAGHFSFVGDERFPRRCIAAGAAGLMTGLGIDLALFVVWLTQGTSPTRALGLAGLAQALIITGASLAGFGFIHNVLDRRKGYSNYDGDIDIAEFGLGFGRSPESFTG